MEERELPVAFVMALSRNRDAMSRFEAMTEAEKEAVLLKTGSVQSKGEMERLVERLGLD